MDVPKEEEMKAGTRCGLNPGISNADVASVHGYSLSLTGCVWGKVWLFMEICFNVKGCIERHYYFFNGMRDL